MSSNEKYKIESKEGIQSFVTPGRADSVLKPD